MAHRFVRASALLAVLFAACAPEEPAAVPRPPVRRAATPAAIEPLKPVEPPAPLACGDDARGFEEWLATFRADAAARGIPSGVLRALDDVTYEASVVALDRTQRAHKVPFEELVASHVTPARVRRGRQQLGRHADLLAGLERRYGVAREILVALWGLETDFGRNQGSTRSLRALATLAYDCRRAELFRGELESALRLLRRGDLTPDAMIGAWAGELGQTQFLPSSYERFGVDGDGDGRVDLVGSVPDALGSTANYLVAHGWRAGEGYAEGTPNFDVLTTWNRSEVYRRTVAVFASKLARR